MSKHKYGLLLSQLLDCVSRPFEEEQVWALCYEICQSLLSYLGKAVNPNDEIVLHFSGVTFAVETIYLRRDGRVTFIPNSNSREKYHISAEEIQESLTKQMRDLSKVLTTCLENGGPKEFLKRQVGSDLESLIGDLSLGEFAHRGSQWVDMVADCCIRHALSQTVVIPPDNYRGICELLVKEAMEMNNFLTVVMNEIAQCESIQDAFSTFQLSQARPVISNWLQCMSEIRDGTTQKHEIDALRFPSSKNPIESCSELENLTQSSAFYVSPPRSMSILPKIDEQIDSSESTIQLDKPSHHSTPTVVYKKPRKVLRPPQRLVNQVTTWILEGEPKDTSCAYDVSWLPGKQLNPVASSLGWFREAKRIRRVLTELQIDTAMDDESLYNALRNGEICFCCRVTKFSLFHRSCMNCEVCERKICSSCITRVTSRELGMSPHDSTLGSHDSGMSSRDFESCSRDFENCSRDEIDSDDGSLFGQIRKVFKPKASGGEKYCCNMCQDCRDFIQRYF